MGATTVEQVPQSESKPVGGECHPLADIDGSGPVVEAKSQQGHGMQSDRSENCLDFAG